MNYLNPIPKIEKWGQKNPVNNILISFFCLFLILLVGKLEAQSVITCPQDIQASVDANQCSAVVNYSVGYTTNCESVEFTQSIDNQSVTMSVGCLDALGSQHLRVFDLNAMGVAGPLALESIDLGIGYATPGAMMTLNFYTLSGAVNYGNMTLIGTQAVTLPALLNSVYSIPVSVTAPAGSVLVVEVVVPAGPNITLVGYNAAGETATSYYASQGTNQNNLCGFSQPVDANTLGLGAFDLVLTLNSDPTNLLTQTAGLASGVVYPLGTTTNSYLYTNACGASEQCSFNVTVVDDIAPVLTCPSLPAVYLPAGQCETQVTYNVTATDGCDSNPVVTQTGGAYTSGDSFPAGLHTLTYQAQDAAGNISTCSFDIEVVSPGAGGTFACSNDLNIALGPNCEVALNAVDLLLGGYDCNSSYDVYAVSANGDIIGSVLDGTYAGQTLQVIVSEVGGNKCWGYITLEDKIAPTINCTDATVNCNEPTSVAAIGEPTSYDACGNVALTHTDDVEDFGCFADFNRIIKRTWVATDKAGNTASCIQTINVQPVTLADVTFPTNYDTFANPHIECGSGDNTDPDQTGYPTINGIVVDNGDICGISFDYTDFIHELCGGSYKVVRTWTVLEWCTNNIITHVQTIKVLDKTPPVLSCPSLIQVPTSPSSCSATFVIPSINVTDACSDFTVSVATPDYTFPFNGGAGINLELGTHTLVYTAVDECGNYASCTLTVEVFDNVPPVAVCDSNTAVSLDQTGNAQVCAATLNDGSYDNCGNIVVKIKRMDALASVGYTDCVGFTCSDIGSPVMVNMRIYDVVGTFADNDPTARYNECVIEVQVSDNISPTIVCPSDVILTCEQDETDHSLTGIATGADVCGLNQLNYEDVDYRDQCGVGEVIRTYVIGDLNNNPTVACVQTITFVDSTPIVIDFPNDYDANNCLVTGQLSPENLPAGFGEPVITGDNCELVSVNYTDELFVQDPAACYQIHRNWKVVEWCKYDGNDTSEPGVTRHTQVITLTDDIAPQITSGCDDLEFCSYDSNCHSGTAELFFQATDNCLLPELLHYRYEIDLNSDGGVDVSANSAVATADYPLGVHTIKFIVTDGCGNTDSCTKQFTITDCKKPTPVCINGLAIDLMPTTGEISIAPLDFESGSSFDNCTAQSDLLFSFSSDVTDVQRTYTCADFGTQIVELWVTDENGNQDFCQTYIIVQDNNNVCQNDQNLEISGYIETEENDLVEDVDVQIMNSNALPFTTSSNGSFVFPSILLNNNYTIHPEKDINPLNGVTTLDLVFIQQHILGVADLNSPYKIIAADVNGSNTVTTLDIVTLQRLILGVDANFQNNTSWRFVDMDFVFPDPTDPFASTFPEDISYNGINSDELATDFVGVKIGDVNGTAIPNALLGSQLRSANGALTFNLNNQDMIANETYTVDFTSSDFKDVLGYQFTIDFDATQLEMLEVIPGALSNMNETNFGLANAQNGIITTSWSNAKALSTAADEILFSIKFNALNTVSLNEVLSLTSKATKAESYNAQFDVMDVELNYNSVNTTATNFEVLQNQPNPFTTATTIAFNLPQADDVTLTISDLSGKVLKVINGAFAEGYNEIKIGASDLNETGVMIYRIESGDFTSTKKMIFIK